MVHGFDSNEEFISLTDKLLGKLKKKGLWNEDTLVIGLDKSIRPLAYTLRKLSKERKEDVPQIRYFNYSTHTPYGSINKITGFKNIPKGINPENIKEVSEFLVERINPKKFSEYKNVLILDEGICSGSTLRNARKVFQEYFSKSEKAPKIHIAALGMGDYGERSLSKDSGVDDVILGDENIGVTRGSYSFTGISDGFYSQFASAPIHHSIKEAKREFIENRKQLSKDIQEYTGKIYLNEGLEGKTLEKKILTGFFSERN
jgi:hypothetical protein